jgi:hypothetical protein
MCRGETFCADLSQAGRAQESLVSGALSCETKNKAGESKQYLEYRKKLSPAGSNLISNYKLNVFGHNEYNLPP